MASVGTILTQFFSARIGVTTMTFRHFASGVLALVVISCALYVRADVTFFRGDVDESGGLEITDAIRIFRFLFLGDGGSVRCLDAADVDDDGTYTRVAP